MKKTTVTILLLFALNSYSQDLPDFKVPKTYKKVLEVKGDLDKDGIPEIVYAYNTDREMKPKDDSPALGFERELYICKKIGGKIKLWKNNKTILWKSDDFGFYRGTEAPPVNIKIKNNTLIIEQDYDGNSKYSGSYKDIFRYQNNDWFLIGSCTAESFSEDNFYMQYDINYSTKIMETKKIYTYNDEKKLPKTVIKREPCNKKMIKMDDFTTKNPGN